MRAGGIRWSQMGKWAEADPVVEAQAEGGWSLEPDPARSNRVFDLDIPEPDSGQGFDVRRHDEINVEARIVQAKVKILLVLVFDEPVALLSLPGIRQIDANDDASYRQMFGPDPAPHVPHQQTWIEIRGCKGGSHVLQTPEPYSLNKGIERLTSFSQKVPMPFSALQWTFFNQTERVELLQSARQEGGGHQRHPAMEVVETMAPTE
ncbi:hypothetical protein BH24CHL4_BH24CHL4_26680 [soil metagenome]